MRSGLAGMGDQVRVQEGLWVGTDEAGSFQ